MAILNSTQILKKNVKLRIQKVFFLFLVTIFSFLISKQSFAEDDTPFGLAKNYLFVTTHKNYPIAKTDVFFDSGSFSYGIKYFHTLGNEWVMSVGGNFKNFEEDESKAFRSISTMSHETLTAIRMYYPAYFLVGVRMLYLLPSLSNSVPPKRDGELDAEVGVGISAYIFTKIADNYNIFFRTGRWRGTKTTNLQSYDITIGLGKSF